MQKNKFENSNILVTGGAGLVGSHIVDLLCEENCNIIIYDSFIIGRKEHLNNAKKKGNIEIGRGRFIFCDTILVPLPPYFSTICASAYAALQSRVTTC